MESLTEEVGLSFFWGFAIAWDVSGGVAAEAGGQKTSIIFFNMNFHEIGDFVFGEAKKVVFVTSYRLILTKR